MKLKFGILAHKESHMQIFQLYLESEIAQGLID